MTKPTQPDGGGPAASSTFERYRTNQTTPEIALGVALVLTARRWRSVTDEALRPLGQSSARMEALSAIMHSPAPSAQVDIARRLRIEGPTLTRMIDALSRDGLVERRPAPDDRRTKHLYLTAKGLTELEQIFAVVDPLRERFLADLSLDEKQAMTATLQGMLGKLDAGLPET